MVPVNFAFQCDPQLSGACSTAKIVNKLIAHFDSRSIEQFLKLKVYNHVLKKCIANPKVNSSEMELFCLDSLSLNQLDPIFFN